METKTSPSKFALPYGAIFGAIMVLQFVVSYSLDIDPVSNKSVGIVINLLNYIVLPVGFILTAGTTYKKQINLGFISLGEAIKIGIIIMLIGAIIYSVFYAVFVNIEPEFIEKTMQLTRSVMVNENPSLTTEQIDMALDIQKKFMQPQLMAPIAIAMYSFIGLIYSLIIGAIIKKEQK
jgi:hypothetical protein